MEGDPLFSIFIADKRKSSLIASLWIKIRWKTGIVKNVRLSIVLKHLENVETRKRTLGGPEREDYRRWKGFEALQSFFLN